MSSTSERESRTLRTGRIVVAGGGTGGHVYPAIAIADALVASGRDKDSIVFFGSSRALEATAVPRAGYKITLLPGRGIKRKLSMSNLGAVLGLVTALFKAIAMLSKDKPEAVVSVGGYAASPAAIAAVLLRVPLIVVESNAVPGAVHRLVAPFAKVCAVAWPGTRLDRSVVTGNPVRKDLVQLDRTDRARVAEARRSLGIPEDKFVVASFGGSLGSATLNSAMRRLFEIWTHRDDVAIYHVVGKRDWAKADWKSTDKRYRTVEYENDMASLYLAADIAVTRSGATTAAELAASGTPSVLVPFPRATGNHQTANANVMARVGAAIVVKDSDCTGDALAEVIGPLIGEPEAITKMSTAARSLAAVDAAERVAELIEMHARSGQVVKG